MSVPLGVALSAGVADAAAKPALSASIAIRKRSTRVPSATVPRYFTASAKLRVPCDVPVGDSTPAAPPSCAVNFVAPPGPGPGVYVNTLLHAFESVTAPFRPFVHVLQ